MTTEQRTYLEALYRDNQEKLYLYAVSILQKPEIAMDMVQDTFHTAAIRIDILMAHWNPSGWLMNTLKHKIHDQKRSMDRYTARFVSLTDYELWAADEAAENFTEDHPPTVREIWGRVRNVLSPDDRCFLRRILLEKASHREVAKELGITVWASQKRLERIRKELEKHFPEYKRSKTKNKKKKISKIMSALLFCGNI